MSKSSTKRIVLLQGSFDIINWGHIKAFQKAKAEGDYLIIALNSNALLKRYKGANAVLPWYQKKFIIESCRFVDKVVRVTEMSPMKLLKRYDVMVYALTQEWKDTKPQEIAYIQNKGGKILWLPRFNGAVTTRQIKNILLKEVNSRKRY